MEANVHLRRLKEWAKLVFEAENSSNKTVWCQENGIRYRKYMYWQQLVREYLLEHGDHSLDSNDHDLPAAASGAPQLADITSKIQGEPPALPGSYADQDAACSSPELMVRYGDCQIYVGRSVSEETLTTVLRAIRHA